MGNITSFLSSYLITEEPVIQQRKTTRYRLHINEFTDYDKMKDKLLFAALFFIDDDKNEEIITAKVLSMLNFAIAYYYENPSNIYKKHMCVVEYDDDKFRIDYFGHRNSVDDFDECDEYMKKDNKSIDREKFTILWLSI